MPRHLPTMNAHAARGHPSSWWRRSRLRRIFIHAFIWHGTEKLAWLLYRVTKWADEPNQVPRWISRWPAGLSVACWTHVCGHGLRYSFDIGSIYWFPRYAKRRLRLPDQGAAGGGAARIDDLTDRKG